MKPAEVLEAALAITQELIDDDIRPTLRQVYYQFVSLTPLPSGDNTYKRIGKIVTKARYDGTFPIDWLIDAGRTIHSADATRNDVDAGRAIRRIADWMRYLPEAAVRRGVWYGQPNHVSVWFEKEALAGVFGPTCDDLGVGYFACKGYPSVSSLYEWLLEARKIVSNRLWKKEGEQHEGTAERVVILYLGDHDPDGWEIPRSAERNLEKLQDLLAVKWGREQALAYGWEEDDPDLDDEAHARAWEAPRIDIEMRRLGLSMEQIEQYNLPPFAVKKKSARYQAYLDEHGIDGAWELDALKPTVLRQLVTDEVAKLFNKSIATENQELVDEVRAEVLTVVREREFLDKLWP